MGTKKLSTLAADDASSLYKRKLAEGLAPSSVRRIHEILKQALRETVRLKYISHNPLDDVKSPKGRTREMEVLTPEQVKRLLRTARGHRWEGVVVLEAACGLRIGEALSLHYEDLNLAEGTISIHRTLWKYNVHPRRPQAADEPSSFLR